MALAADRLALLARRADTLLALPPDQRAAWLSSQQPDEIDLLPHLQRLLDVGTEQGPGTTAMGTTALAASLRRLVADSLDATLAPVAGDLIGPYRLIEPLGEGGMGVVWRARRMDWTERSVQREVALKLPFVQAGQRRWAERFARERDILARLEHPHIARLYDAGLTPNGQPWLAMALVDGQPINTYADAQRLSLRGRIALFMQVLAAVQFAHAHLVVHRDLKPSNIYVDATGQVQLLDFGIALPLDDAAQSDAPLTEVGQALLTPDYAAPEQLLRGPVSTAADVYSLGVVLFELLCGRRPHLRGEGGRAAIEQAVLHSEPTSASRAGRDATAEVAERRASRPASLSRQLRGDLDNILAKAMRREPVERYASAEAFAADLQRHLDGVPVLAHPGSLGYRAAKFWRRNRLAAGASAAVVVALMAGTGLALWQANVARQQASQATREARKARAVQAFLVGLFDAANPAKAQGRDQSVRELLDAGERDLKTKLANEPEVRAAVGGVLVDIYIKLDDPQHALPLAEDRAELLRQTQGEASGDYAVALSTVGVGQFQLGRSEAALQTLLKAEPLLARHAAQHIEDWLDLLRTKAQSLGQVGRDAEAVQVQQALLPQLAAHYGSSDWELLFERSAMAINMSRAGDCTGAIAQANALAPSLHAPPSERGVEAAVMLGNLGGALWRCGQLDEAIAMLTRSAPAIAPLQGDHTPSAAAAQRVLGQAQLDAGDVRAALASLRDFKRRVVPTFGNDAAKIALAQALLVEPLLLLNQTDAALAAAQGAGAQRPILEALVGLFSGKPAPDLSAAVASLSNPSDPTVASRERARNDMVQAAADLVAGRTRAAAERAEGVAKTYLAMPARSFHDRLQAAKATLTEALALAAAGDATAASARQRSAKAALQALLPAQHPLLLQAELVRAKVLRAAGQADAAQRLERSTREALQTRFGIGLPANLPLVL